MKITYSYNELIKEYNYDTNKIVDYTYDNSGNIVEVTTTDINNNIVLETNNYNYTNSNWEDQLTKYNNEDITYDEIGNPITIGNKTLTWINGRSLNTYKDTNKNLDIKYKYNLDGIRTSKIVNNIETKYYFEDDNIIYEQQGNNIIYYLYDLTGLTGIEYNGDTYYYIKNLQEDIIGILDSNYEKVVSYEYDSWGKILSIKDNQGNEITDENNIGLINPFRYRSYYYDVETELYYLNSRYYNHEWKRFINADEILGANKDLISYNLYAYCSNSPIMLSDSSGHGLLSGLKKVVKKIVKAVAKAIITIGSNLFLSAKGYNVSNNMFNKSMYHPEGNISKSTQNQIKQKSQNSSQVQTAIKNCVSQNSGSNSFSDCLGYKNAEMSGDLFYSIQHIDLYVSGTIINNSTWDITISMSDVYDFEHSDGNSFADRVNNLGYYMQENGLLKTYSWNTSYKLKYKE